MPALSLAERRRQMQQHLQKVPDPCADTELLLYTDDDWRRAMQGIFLSGPLFSLAIYGCLGLCLWAILS